jgi:hypothetical protein
VKKTINSNIKKLINLLYNTHPISKYVYTMQVIALNKIIKHNDRWYKLLRYVTHANTLNKDGAVNMAVLGGWRDYVGADKVLRDGGGFMLCETIQDCEYTMVEPDDDDDYDGEDIVTKEEEYNDDEYEY